MLEDYAIAPVSEDVRARVQAAIDALPDPLREVVVLRDYEGLDHGAIADRLRPSSRPVTAAEQSLTVEIGLPASLHHNISARTQNTTHWTTTRIALVPKKYIPAKVAGIREIITSAIIACTSCLACRCGEELTSKEPSSGILTSGLFSVLISFFVSIFILSIAFNYFFFFLSSALQRRMCWMIGRCDGHT